LSIIQATKNFILDTLFPINCLSCGKDNVWLCPDCLKNINFLSFQVCPKCEQTITDSGLACPKCKPLSELDALIVASKYKENNIDKLVHLYKYRFIEDLSVPLGKILVAAILKSQLPIPDIIIPVPLHPRRLRWRGFNQSQLLAEYIGKNLAPNFEIPVAADLLRRKKYTPPQMKIKTYSERQNNLKNAFTVNDTEEIKDKNIILVDDIATTGSTLFECAKVLKQNGAKKVFGVVIARQEFE